MQFLLARVRATWTAMFAFLMQVLLWIDQGCNVALGLKAILLAALTGEEQATCFADETLSAHAWRAEQANKPWAKLTRAPIDRLFFWQGRDSRIDAKVGEPVAGHCRRAFWKKKLRLGLPKEYQD